MLNALMGRSLKKTNANTFPPLISGLSVANMIKKEAAYYENLGNIDKAKECFEIKIRETENELQCNFNQSKLIKIRELLAACYFYYGNFLHALGDENNSKDNYKKSLEHASIWIFRTPT